MPRNLVKTRRDERLWNEAVALAAERGRDDYAYVVGIFKRMRGGVQANPDGEVRERRVVAPRRPVSSPVIETSEPETVSRRGTGRLSEMGDVTFRDPLTGRKVTASVQPRLSSDEIDVLAFNAQIDMAQGKRRSPSFEQLLRELMPYLYAVAFKTTQDRGVAEEALSFALARLNKSLLQFEGESSFKTWAYRVVKSATIDALRSQEDDATRYWRRRQRYLASKAGMSLQDWLDSGQAEPKPSRASGGEGEDVFETVSGSVGRGARARLSEDEPEVEDYGESEERITPDQRMLIRRQMRRLTPAQQEILQLREPDLFTETPGVKGLSYDDIAQQLGIPIGTVMSRLYSARKELEKLSGVVLARKRRGARGVKKNPGDPYDFESSDFEDGSAVYVETVEDVADLYQHGLIDEETMDVLLAALEDT